MSQAPDAGNGMDQNFIVTDSTDQGVNDPGQSFTEPREASANINSGGAQGTVNYVPPVNNTTQSNNKGFNCAPNADDATLFYNYVRAASADTILSQEGEAYYESLKKYLSERNIRIDRLPNTNGFLVQEPSIPFGIPLAFQETLPRATRPFYPYTDALNNILEDARIFVQDKINILDPILITNTDYNKSKDMSQSIEWFLKSTFSDVATMNALSNCTFRIIVDQDRVKQNLINMTPSGILPYVQYGVSIEVLNKINNFTNEGDWVPLFTIGAYTEFIRDDERTYGERRIKFSPIINISACAIRFTSVVLAPIVLQMAYRVFLMNNMWIQPFKHFDPSNDHEANLGQLILDDHTRPSFLNNSMEFEDFLYTCINAPALAIEITDGHLNYPGLALLTTPSNVNFLKNRLADAVASNQSEINLINSIDDNMIKNSVSYYTGITNYEGSVVDTRTIDYFKICRGNAADKRLLDQFLMYTSYPEDRIQAISDAGFGSFSGLGSNTGVQSLYTTAKYILDPKALEKFVSLTSKLHILNAPMVDRGNILSGSLLAEVGNQLRNDFRMNNTVYSSNNSFVGRTLFNQGNFTYNAINRNCK